MHRFTHCFVLIHVHTLGKPGLFLIGLLESLTFYKTKILKHTEVHTLHSTLVVSIAVIDL